MKSVTQTGYKMEAYENVRNNDEIEVGYKMAQNRPYRLHRLQNMNVVHECVTVVTDVTSIPDTHYIYVSYIIRGSISHRTWYV